MRKLFLLVILATVLCVVVPIPVGALEDPVSVSSSLLYMDFQTGGTAVLGVTVTNTSGVDLTVVISSWWNYTTPGDDYEWIDPVWVTAIEPDSQLLIPGGQMIANVQYTIPDNAGDFRYQTWIKVAVGGWEKPIMVIIRKGSAIPSYEYAVSPAYYKLLVYGSPASIVVNNTSDEKAPPIGIRSKCSATTYFYVAAESSREDIVITEDSSIQHTEEEVGITYKQLSDREAQDWFSTSYTTESPLKVGPFTTGYAMWSLSVPDNVGNGYYALAVRISPAESTGMMTTNYLVWMLVKVDREGGAGHGFPWRWIVVGILCTSLILMVSGTIIRRKLYNRRLAYKEY